MGKKPRYPDAQKEANKTPAYKGGTITALEGNLVVTFKARKNRNNYIWSATWTTATGTEERMVEARATHAEASRAGQLAHHRETVICVLNVCRGNEY